MLMADYFLSTKVLWHPNIEPIHVFNEGAPFTIYISATKSTTNEHRDSNKYAIVYYYTYI